MPVAACDPASGVALEGLVPDFRLVWVGLSAVKGQVRCRSMRRQLGPRHGSNLHRGGRSAPTVRGPGGGRLGVAGDELPSLRSGPIGAFESRRPAQRGCYSAAAWGVGRISWRRRWPARGFDLDHRFGGRRPVAWSARTAGAELSMAIVRASGCTAVRPIVTVRRPSRAGGHLLGIEGSAQAQPLAPAQLAVLVVAGGLDVDLEGERAPGDRNVHGRLGTPGRSTRSW